MISKRRVARGVAPRTKQINETMQRETNLPPELTDIIAGYALDLEIWEPKWRKLSPAS